MNSLQVSDWSTAETYPSNLQNLPKNSNESKIARNDSSTADVNQFSSNDQTNTQ
jgi:hypothetical protein